MSSVTDRIAGALTAEVGRRGWDEPPALYFLYLEGGQPRLSQILVPLRMWALDRPPQVLERLSRATGKWAPLLQATAPEGLHGAAFYCETWAVDQAPPGTAERSEVEADAWAHRLYLRDDRVEARSMWAVDRAGILYNALLRRDVDTVPLMSMHHPGPDGRPAVGTVPEALGRIVSSILGVGL